MIKGVLLRAALSVPIFLPASTQNGQRIAKRISTTIAHAKASNPPLIVFLNLSNPPPSKPAFHYSMITQESIRNMALALPEVTEDPHFEKTSFRVAKKIFATMEAGSTQITVKLSPANQDVFGTFSKALIYPVPNKWGLQGWTVIQFTTLPAPLLQDILTTAYAMVAPKKLAALVSDPSNNGK